MTLHVKRLLVAAMIMVLSSASAAITFFLAPLWGLLVLSSLMFVGFYLCITAFTGDPTQCDKLNEVKKMTWRKQKEAEAQTNAQAEQNEADLEQAYPQNPATVASHA